MITHGIDLGQVNDYTAYAVFQTSNGVSLLRYACRMRDASYKSMMETLAIKINKKNGLVLGDATGAASPAAFEFLTPKLPKAQFIPVKITGGDEVNYSNGYLCVPNGVLIDNLKIGMQNETVKFPKTLVVDGVDMIPIIMKELQGFSAVKSDSGHWRFKSTGHDDTLFAVALALYGKNLADMATARHDGYPYRVY